MGKVANRFIMHLFLIVIYDEQNIIRFVRLRNNGIIYTCTYAYGICIGINAMPFNSSDSANQQIETCRYKMHYSRYTRQTVYAS